MVQVLRAWKAPERELGSDTSFQIVRRPPNLKEIIPGVREFITYIFEDWEKVMLGHSIVLSISHFNITSPLFPVCQI